MVLEVFQKLVAFIVVLGILIAFHEFGHFWVARRLGVKVLRFSIGLGKPILRYQSSPDAPEYVVSALPLGGYVSMLGEQEGVDIPPEDAHRAFSRKPVWARIAIVAAGPVFNLVLAIVLFAAVFMVGVPDIRPVLNQPEPDTPAWHAGVKEQDLVTGINGEAVSSWSVLRLAMIQAALESPEVSLELTSPSGSQRTVVLDTETAGLLEGEEGAFSNLGLALWRATRSSEVGTVSPDSAAAKAGIQTGDVITQINGDAVDSWRSLVQQVSVLPGQQVTLSFLRNGETVSSPVTLGSVERNGRTVGLLGVSPAQDPYQEYRITQQYGAVDAVQRAVQRTWDTSWLLLKLLSKIVVGEASVKNLSGPLTIADYAGETAKIGLRYLLEFMAAVSVSLGVLNLLPIPMLDGGHLLYYTIELIKGSPVSEQIIAWGQVFGAAVLVLLMVVAFYNDFTRLFG